MILLVPQLSFGGCVLHDVPTFRPNKELIDGITCSRSFARLRTVLHLAIFRPNREVIDARASSNFNYLGPASSACCPECINCARTWWFVRLIRIPSMPPTEQATLQAEYRRLGNSGLRVSVPIVGAATFGSSKWLPWVLDEEQVCGNDCNNETPNLTLHTGTASAESSVGPRTQHMGHRKLVLEW